MHGATEFGAIPIITLKLSDKQTNVHSKVLFVIIALQKLCLNVHWFVCLPV